MPRNYLIQKTSRIPDQWCPVCFAALDGASSMGSESIPEPGDFMVCINCGDVLRFGDDLYLVPSNLMEVPVYVRMEFAKIVQAIKALGRRGVNCQPKPM